MTKEEKRTILKNIKEKKKLEFEASLPMSRCLFKELFDYLDAELDKAECTNELYFTMQFLEKHKIDEETVVAWLKKNGGYCDCEVLNNVEEKFEQDAIF